MAREAARSHPGGGDRRRVGWLEAAAIAGTAAAAGAAAWQSLFRYFQVDEYVFVRCAWLFSRGETPYRDFFDHHTPLFYALLSPVVGAAPESPAVFDAARAVSLGLLGLLLLLVWRLARRIGGREGAWLAVFLLATAHAFVARGIEIRPDLLAATAFLGMADLLLADGGRRRGLAAGLLAAVALLSTQKALYYLWGVGVLVAVDLARRTPTDRRRRFLGPPAGSVLVGFAVAVVGVAGALALRGALAEFWEQNVTLAVEWQGTFRRFPALDYLLPALRLSPHWAVGVLLGGCALALDPSLRRGLSPRRWAVYGALAAPAVLSLAINPTPWPYNLLPVFAILAPLAAPMAPWARSLRPLARVASLAGLLLLAALSYPSRLRVEAERGQTAQREALRRVLAVTEPDLPIFDANGGYLFRPAAYRIWYHSAAMRAALSERFDREMVPSILAAGAPAAIVDFRFPDLPPSVREFVQWNYQRYHGALFLWGSAYQAASPPDGTRFTFRAIRDGEYFLQTAELGDRTPAVRVGGTPVAVGRPFQLAAGEHPVEVAAAPGDPATPFFLLWRPPTGELWRPLPGAPPPYYPFRPGDAHGWNATRPGAVAR
ncbi:MAG: glycosyltransferase family 39 protein [Thermoanaerobaculia bacterium]|nr:glycosyltransferase family 39 protein [Thermoanaerobaculia bacterium]